MGGKTNYDDKFDDVMRYARINLESKGVRKRINDKEDLRKIFERLDNERRDQQSEPKMSDTFINKLLGTRRADAMVGREVGRFGREKTAPRYQGKEIYAYSGGSVVKEVFKNNKNAVRFRDTKTGRFVSKRRVS